MKDVDKISIRQGVDGAIIAIKAVPGASRDKISGPLANRLKITTSTAPEKGRANQAIGRTIAKAFNIDKRNVEIVGGLTNPQKEFLIRGFSVEELREMLAKL